MQTGKLHKLFSYGTLRYEQVQRDTFGRVLEGREDSLVGYRLDQVEITDPAVLASSGETFHPIVSFTGDPQDRVPGSVLKITDSELAHADSYEVDDYQRVEAALASGDTAWVYVAANQQL